MVLSDICTARIFRIAGKWDGAGASWYGIKHMNSE
jgi:hypothetical protein